MMRVLGDKVLVALPPLETEREESIGYDYRAVKTTESGVILAHRGDSYSEEASTRGIVMQLGEKTEQVNATQLLDALEAIDPVAIAYGVKTADGVKVPPGEMALLCVDIHRVLQSLKPAPFDVQVGDCVLFAPSAGNAFEHDGIHYVLLREDELLAVLEPQKADAA